MGRFMKGDVVVIPPPREIFLKCIYPQEDLTPRRQARRARKGRIQNTNYA